MMKKIPTEIPDLFLFEPRIFGDARGFFYESYHEKQFSDAIGYTPQFVQDNHSKSCKYVLRGLHYQIEHPQGKLVRVISGEVFDVAVDIRKDSMTFGKWIGVILSEQNKRLFWIPEGFAHGFLVLSDTAEFLYKTTDFYYPEYERTLLWNDPELGITWPTQEPPKLSSKDREGKPLQEAEWFDANCCSR